MTINIVLGIALFTLAIGILVGFIVGWAGATHYWGRGESDVGRYGFQHYIASGAPKSIHNN